LTNLRDDNIILLPENKIINARRSAYPFFKRLFDIVFSLAAIILLAIPMMIIGIVVRLETPGPAIFRQNRVGRNGRLFSICKFRTMFCTAPRETATAELKNAESYITKVGAFLRKSSLDELPQLFNVLRGDMSFIGPRPLIASEEEIHLLREASDVYSVRPGMTGWAQVNGRDCISIADKVAYDSEYAHDISFFFDLKVLFRTVFVVASGDGYAEGCRTSADDSDIDIGESNNNAA